MIKLRIEFLEENIENELVFENNKWISEVIELQSENEQLKQDKQELLDALIEVFNDLKKFYVNSENNPWFNKHKSAIVPLIEKHTNKQERIK